MVLLSAFIPHPSSFILDEAIRGEVTLRAALLLLKYMVREDLGERLGTILGLLRELAGRRTGLEYLETILRYLSKGTDKLSSRELEQVISEVFAEGEELMPTIAEQWLEQGRAEGLVRGREEGREEGREAALVVLRRFVAHRFGVAIDRFDADLFALDLADITELSDAAFEVDSLAEFERRLAELKAGA